MMPYFAFFLIVLYISAYSILCLSSLFPSISRRCVIRARVGDDNLDFSALATLDALCFIISVMDLFVVSMLSSSCSVSILFQFELEFDLL